MSVKMNSRSWRRFEGEDASRAGLWEASKVKGVGEGEGKHCVLGGKKQMLTLWSWTWVWSMCGMMRGFLSNRDDRAGHVGPEGPDKVGCIGWSQITKDSEGSNHRELENRPRCLRYHSSKLPGGWQGLKGAGHWKPGNPLDVGQLSNPSI